MNDLPENKPKSSDPAKWVEKYSDALFGYALRYINDKTIAEDLVQETLLAALKGRSSFAGGSSEQTWLIGILKNKIIDHYRKSNRDISSEKTDNFIDTDHSDYILSGSNTGNWHPRKRPAHWSVDTDDPVEQQQFWEHLQKCLEGLDSNLSRVYNMRDIQQIEYQEVCNVLAVKPTNLRVMLHRARKLMRSCLETNWINK